MLCTLEYPRDAGEGRGADGGARANACARPGPGQNNVSVAESAKRILACDAGDAGSLPFSLDTKTYAPCKTDIPCSQSVARIKPRPSLVAARLPAYNGLYSTVVGVLEQADVVVVAAMMDVACAYARVYSSLRPRTLRWSFTLHRCATIKPLLRPVIVLSENDIMRDGGVGGQRWGAVRTALRSLRDYDARRATTVLAKRLTITKEMQTTGSCSSRGAGVVDLGESCFAYGRSWRCAHNCVGEESLSRVRHPRKT